MATDGPAGRRHQQPTTPQPTNQKGLSESAGVASALFLAHMAVLTGLLLLGAVYACFNTDQFVANMQVGTSVTSVGRSWKNRIDRPTREAGRAGGHACMRVCVDSTRLDTSLLSYDAS